jgi:hypothetical protein
MGISIFLLKYIIIHIILTHLYKYLYTNTYAHTYIHTFTGIFLSVNGKSLAEFNLYARMKLLQYLTKIHVEHTYHCNSV